ncbi:hypothetical protein TNCV_3462411 [Trichonephila clavipes]|nr:hypothetical protein TNCV_3462411 [Trichonephila clavipes]
MINAKQKERFLPDPGTIVLRQDINLITGKPFRIKTCCSSQMLINSLREDTEYLLDLGVNGMGQSNRTLPVVWLERVNRYPYPRIKCIKYRHLNQVTRAEINLSLKGKFCRKEQRGIVGQQIDFVLKWLSRVGSEVGPTKGREELREQREETRKETEKEKKRDEREGGDGKREEKESGERERGAGLGWRKGFSPRLEWKDDERRLR